MKLARRRLFPCFGLAVLALASAVPAGAATATYVSVQGHDTWPCSALRPCRTFAAAFALTDPGGTVVALDSGIFATQYLNLTRSVTITAAPGVHALLRPASFAAVAVNAGASAVVTLRGLTMMPPAGAATPFNGIVYNSAGALYVEDCSVVGFPTKGMIVLSSGRLVVRNSVVRGGIVGISLDAPVRAAFEGVTVSDSQFGLMSSLGATASIRSSLVTGNGVGLLIDGAVPPRTAELNIDDCLITHNDTGIEVRASATARLSRSTLSDNTTGIRVGSGVLETRGDNTVRGNATDVAGTLTPIAGE